MSKNSDSFYWTIQANNINYEKSSVGGLQSLEFVIKSPSVNNACLFAGGEVYLANYPLIANKDENLTSPYFVK